MKLPIERITTDRVDYRYSASREWWVDWDRAADAATTSLVEDLSLVVAATRSGDEVTLEGSIEGQIEVECSRCLRRYRHALSDTFHLVLEPIGDRRPLDPEGEESLEQYGMCLSDELEVGWYRGTEVLLDPYFAEVTALAMPIQPLCMENCAGLCPHCGIDRNQTRCDCTDIKPDSPFAVLAALRGGSDGSI